MFDLLPEDHECFLYQELFEQLDTSEVEAQYSDRGQRAYAPRQIVSILIYAYSRGVFSSRQIEQRCREDLGFMYIAGRNCPNFRVLSDFRKDRGEFFRAGFKQTVQLALALGLVSLGHLSQQANDAQEVAPALDEVEETSGRLPEMLSLDNGYYSGKNLQETSDRKVEAYQPVAKVATAFDRPCIPADCVATRSHTPGMLVCYFLSVFLLGGVQIVVSAKREHPVGNL